jgi:S1/P1 nuclease
MRTIISATVFAAGVALVPVSAAAWDYPGHRVVGMIADIVLQRDYPAAHSRVSELLDQKFGTVVDKRDLGEVAVFPDCAKNEAEYCGRKPSTEEIDYVLRNIVHKSFHFTNSPLQQKTYRAGGVGTLETDIVQMIDHTVTQLRGKQPYYKQDVKLNNTEAVWLLAHLVGDIHQPLHVGQIYYDSTCDNVIDPNASKTVEAISTFGGNLIKLPSGPIKNLHLYWDSIAVKKAMADDGFTAGITAGEEGFAKKLANVTPQGWQTPGPVESWPESWVAEAMPLATDAHEKLTIKKSSQHTPQFPRPSVSCNWETTLNPEYETWAKGVARDRLHKAGYRLAATLKAIFD